MTELTLVLPELGQPDKTEDPKIVNDLTAIHAWANGGIDAGNLTPSYAAFLENLVPTGLVLPFGGAAAPAGWLLCNAAEISRVTYAKLFSVIGTTFGIGNGTTTFNLPDGRGRSVIGAGEATGAAGATNHALGSKGGEEKHTLTEAEMPVHAHNVGFSNDGGGAGTEVSGRAGGDTAGGGSNLRFSMRSDGAFSIGLIAKNAGSGERHNNLQPFVTLNHIIRT